ncbi:MAG TPA: hypothetical protein VHQ42_04795 [Candidatus Limnocylindria bacterium]|nr:hypothetical protein [Candidatus Limnocylindria bacterium]
MRRDDVSVTCAATEDGWRCEAVVGQPGGDATRHEVLVDRRVLEDLAPGAEAELLVAESFAFLLEREPRESILHSFELPIIGRYFAEYPDEIRRRLAR